LLCSLVGTGGFGSLPRFDTSYRGGEMQRFPNTKTGLGVVAVLFAVSVGWNISTAHAKDDRLTHTAAAVVQGPADDTSGPAQKAVSKPAARYYVDFRARTAASYGHAFIWYGRAGQRAVEVAGLHPATDSVVPYILGHVLPVPSETGASYGDLDEQYLTASYRVYLNEAEARLVFAYIKKKQASSPVWNAATINCVKFISDIAEYMGLQVPSSHLLYPEDWVNKLRAMNRGRRVQIAGTP
jgi:hypothetical protein